MTSEAEPALPSAAQRDALERDGYTIVSDALGADFVATLNDDLERLEHQLGITPADNTFEGRATVRIYNLLVHGPDFEAIPVHPAILPIIEHVLDAGCLLSSLSSISITPGERAQPVHADDALMPLAKPHAPTVCNSMLALTDFTEANGATRVVPGSHKAEDSPPYGADIDTVPAEMAAGSVLIWHGSLWHGGGANTTDHRRVGIANNYCAGYIRQQENQQLGIPVEIARRFTPRLQELCGYSLYAGLIGHIDKTHPRELLGTKRDEPLLWDAT